MRIIRLSLGIISCLMISGCKYNFFAQCFIPFSTENGSTKTIDGYGSLKLDKNILLRIRPRRKNFPESGIIEVFRLDEDATPRLIKKLSNLKNALIYN